MSHSYALLTDFYELTMAQGYFLHNHNHKAAFDYFFRRPPFNGGFAVFAGLQDLLQNLENFKYSETDIGYLSTLGLFKKDFLDYLSSFRFSGTIYSADEGDIVFPNEPVLRVEGSIIEAQVIESLLLNILNFQTLIATKAARICQASRGGMVLEFGLRRAQGVNGALSAARAAVIGGASATSDTLAGKLYDIPVQGTMAHSWVMAFNSELEAFENYAEIYPDKCILLIDTYDTLGCGIENAIKTGLNLKEKGYNLAGVRLDSGDLGIISKEVRARLDNAGLNKTKIAVSNDLDEYEIEKLHEQESPIDLWGVGTRLVTGRDDPALTGVYKLAARTSGGKIVPTMKFSNDRKKTTLPGIKQVYRCYNSKTPLLDIITLKEEGIPACDGKFYYLEQPFDGKDPGDVEDIKPLLTLKMKDGEGCIEYLPVQELRNRTVERLAAFPGVYKRINNNEIYKILHSLKLHTLKEDLTRNQ